MAALAYSLILSIDQLSAASSISEQELNLLNYLHKGATNCFPHASLAKNYLA
jgi:hypothetical protein